MIQKAIWLVLLSLCSGCVIIVDPSLDGSFSLDGLDGSLSGLGDGGAGSGGGGCSELWFGACPELDAGAPDSGLLNADVPDAGEPDGGFSFLTGSMSHSPPGDGGTVSSGPAFPGSGTGGMGPLAVIWLIRIDRGTADLAQTDAAWISRVTAELESDGFDVSALAIGALYGGDGTFLWTNSRTSEASMTAALQYFAGQASVFTPAACSTARYFQLGSFNEATHYSFSGSSQAVPATDEGPLGIPAPGAVLVVMVDSNARPYALTDPACATNGSSVASLMGAADGGWQSPFSDLWLPPADVRFVFAFTPEGPGASAQAEQSSCLADPGFPSSAVDSIGPSPLLFFSPLSQQLPETSLGLDLCEASTSAGIQEMNTFFLEWKQSLISGGGP